MINHASKKHASNSVTNDYANGNSKRGPEEHRYKLRPQASPRSKSGKASEAPTSWDFRVISTHSLCYFRFVFERSSPKIRYGGFVFLYVPVILELFVCLFVLCFTFFSWGERAFPLLTFLYTDLLTWKFSCVSIVYDGDLGFGGRLQLHSR